MEPTKEEIIAQNKQLKKQLTKVLENNSKLYAENKSLKRSEDYYKTTLKNYIDQSENVEDALGEVTNLITSIRD